METNFSALEIELDLWAEEPAAAVAASCSASSYATAGSLSTPISSAACATSAGSLC